MTKGQPIQVMIKPVGSRCNMLCSYCYYVGKHTGSAAGGKSRMTLRTLETVIRETFEANPGPVVSFTWHGGEPTLAGLDFYRQAVEIEEKYRPSGFQVWNNLQTNGILLDESWAHFLSDAHFDVGLSIDGTKAVHDSNRKDSGGSGTYAQAMRAVALLLSYGIKPDLLCTVNAASEQDPAGVYRALRDLDTGWIQFIPIVVRSKDGTLTKESVSPEGYGNFLCRIFDEWIHHDLGRTDVQLFAEMARIMAGAKPELCMMMPVCGRVLVAEQDGSIYSCDHFVDEMHLLGNIRKTSLANLVESPAQKEFGESKQKTLTKSCRKCPYLRFCGGGCLKDRFGQSEDGEEGQYILCGGLRKFFSYAEPILKDIMEKSSRGLTSEEIMADLSAPS